MGYRLAIGCAWLAVACSGAGTTSEAMPAMATERTESSPDATAILARMKERYRSATTYRDEGTFIGAIASGTTRESITRAHFRTRWVAPDRLSFVLDEEATRFFEPKRLAIWTPRPGDTKALFLGDVRTARSLDDELRALQGVSHGLTGLVPRWLVDGGCRCSSAYQLRGTVTCGAATCYELTATLRDDDHVTLFVDTTTSALRKYRRHSLVKPAESRKALSPAQRARLSNRSEEPFEMDDTVELEPIFDGPVNETDFAVDTTADQSAPDAGDSPSR